MSKTICNQKLESVAALRKVAETQAAFWQALQQFEAITETDLKAEMDYTEFTDPTLADVTEVLRYYVEN